MFEIVWWEYEYCFGEVEFVGDVLYLSVVEVFIVKNYG